MPNLLRQTYSLCPICQEKIKAHYIMKDDQVYLEKECPLHGNFSTLVWQLMAEGEAWHNVEPPLEKAPPCPEACGLCPEHRQDTCCIVLEVTKRCNLNCTFCFAEAGQGEDVPIAQLKKDFVDLVKQGKSFVQLSGGEPTVSYDLAEIIAAAKEAGIEYVQLNTNGIRLAEDLAYLEELANAGLSFVFLQFDGLEKKSSLALRNRDLRQIKLDAIKNCERVGLGVTLVTALAHGINDTEIGDILSFAWQNSPIVRGVNFQPISYFGRLPENQERKKLTLDWLVQAIEEQTKGLVKKEHLFPAQIDHPLCGFHGDFVITPRKKPKALSLPRGRCACQQGLNPALNKREFLGKRWQRRDDDLKTETNEEIDLFDLDYFAQNVRRNGFTITAINFMDALDLDLERLVSCRLHVYDQGNIVPFCAYYYTPLMDKH